MPEYRIPLNTLVDQETMKKIDEYAKLEGGLRKLSRGVVIDRAISALLPRKKATRG